MPQFLKDTFDIINKKATIYPLLQLWWFQILKDFPLSAIIRHDLDMLPLMTRFKRDFVLKYNFDNNNKYLHEIIGTAIAVASNFQKLGKLPEIY